jgi:energy-coupling factor transporter ATP-binding protein EcfA2
MSPTDGSGTLRARLAVLRNRLQADLDRVMVLRAASLRRSEAEDLLADLQRQSERLQRAAVVTLIGPTGAGKSTLLNALAGSVIATEGIDRPTTRRPVIYAPPDADLSALVGEAVSQPAGHESEGGPLVIRQNNSGPAAGHVLIDAPDLNSIDLQHRATVRALADRSDVLVVVLHHQSIVEAASASFVDLFAGRRGLLFVLNRRDELSDEARRALLAQLETLARTRWQVEEPSIFCVSARVACTAPASPDWPAFTRALETLVTAAAITGVRRLNALGCAARLRVLLQEIAAEVTADLGALSADAASGLVELGRRIVGDVGTHLELRWPDLTDRLCAEAALRWDGPCGWALRARAVSTLGLGVGAAILRRHPLAAAGTAVGSLAADRLQQAWDEQRVGDASGLLATRSEIGAWYVECLAPARLRASRLSGDPEALSLPSAGTIHLRTAALLGEVWQDLLARDLPAVAARSTPRFVRLFLDLPIYAFVLWLVYRVAAGFLAGDYTGVDFLVNAALLAGVYLWGVRLLMRRHLGGRARGALRRARQRVEDALSAEVAESTRGVTEASSDLQAAIDRLCNLDDTWRAELADHGATSKGEERL